MHKLTILQIIIHNVYNYKKKSLGACVYLCMSRCAYVRVCVYIATPSFKILLIGIQM